MSNTNYCQCNIKSRIDRKTVFLKNSSVLDMILFIITLRPVLWQNSSCAQQKTVSYVCIPLRRFNFDLQEDNAYSLERSREVPYTVHGAEV